MTTDLSQNAKANGWSCETFQRSEDYILEFFPEALDPRFKNVKAKLNGLRVEFQETDAWTDSQGRNVAGLAFCPAHTLQVGAAKPMHNALAHESAHIVQDCIDTCQQKDGKVTDGHCNWSDDKVYFVEQKVRFQFLMEEVRATEQSAEPPAN